MSLTLFDPLRSVDTFDRFFEDFFEAPADGQSPRRVERAWRPATDVRADAKGYEFSFDVPGVPKDAIDIRVEDGVLEVSGERKNVEERQDGGYHRRETFRGRFQRSFRLPKDADASEITARCADGVLSVRVGKLASAQPRRIPIASVPEASA
jgi:HSP20 family protein